MDEDLKIELEYIKSKQNLILETQNQILTFVTPKPVTFGSTDPLPPDAGTGISYTPSSFDGEYDKDEAKIFLDKYATREEYLASDSVNTALTAALDKYFPNWK